MARQVHNDQAGPSSSWDVKAGINKAGDLADIQFRQAGVFEFLGREERP